MYTEGLPFIFSFNDLLCFHCGLVFIVCCVAWPPFGACLNTVKVAFCVQVPLPGAVTPVRPIPRQGEAIPLFWVTQSRTLASIATQSARYGGLI